MFDSHRFQAVGVWPSIKLIPDWWVVAIEISTRTDHRLLTISGSNMATSVLWKKWWRNILGTGSKSFSTGDFTVSRSTIHIQSMVKLAEDNKNMLLFAFQHIPTGITTANQHSHLVWQRFLRLIPFQTQPCMLPGLGNGTRKHRPGLPWGYIVRQ